MRFLTIGLGHCGGKIANDFKKIAMESRKILVDVCAINTDKADLATHRQIPEENKLLIGTGKGAAKNWKEGYEAAIQARTNMKWLVEKLLMPDTDVIVLTIGEGGGSGSGIAPIIVEIVEELGKSCIAIATMPFEAESVKAKVNAAMGLDLLYRQEALKTLICIANDKIIAHFPDKLLTKAYEKVNETVVDTFLGLVNLAHLPSKADRIDESELASIFEYPGFATLANYKTSANLVENLAATLRHSWNGSLFADVDASTATGVIFGVKGPTSLFTTVQVDSVRRTFRELLAGRDVMLGIYPVERCRWTSYVGILAGMDVPGKVRELLEVAQGEYQRHRELLEARAKLKKEGLGFKLSERVATPQPTLRPLMERREQLESITTGYVDISPHIGRIHRLLERHSGETHSLDELVDLIQSELAIEDEHVIIASILELQNRGYLIEIRKNMFQIA